MTNNTTELTDDFRGDDANLISSIKALIELNDEGALVPHGIGSHARSLLSAAAVRLTSSRAAVPAPEGWKLVPTTLTEEMIVAGNRALKGQLEPAMHAWDAMLDAAPAAPVATAPKLDTEQMLRDCVPGGDIVDPQLVCDNIRAWFDDRAPDAEAEPIPMLLFCPRCGTQHIDAEEWADDPHDIEQGRMRVWSNPPHRSHLCHACGIVWRPADVATVGVASIETSGKADTWAKETPWIGHNRPAAQAVAADGEATDDLLQLDILLAAFHKAVWDGAQPENPVDYDLAGNDEAKAIQAHVRAMLSACAAVSPATASEREAFEAWAIGETGGWCPEELGRAPAPYSNLYTEDRLNDAWEAWQASAARGAAPAGARPTSFHFHRFVNGQEMAEDVLIERATTIEAAIKEAVRICPKRPMTVLVHAPAWVGALHGGVLAKPAARAQGAQGGKGGEA
ncbi:hypothetical protein F3J16_21685 [Burkholderia sp. Ap-962]|uniref:hypothetical protein n=1 Tax=Burkholderia sp. Ap-962 TaxID=2608333 RepID=UPI0014236E4D|nr:hypothetical protein [Burkholderia sp. Ap-962]NIF72774.1 hypothetical protein [Burkholderia sp. Ap-962]